jgi:hypothetical protein
LLPALGVLALLLSSQAPARGEEIPREYRDTVNRGLKWLAEKQNGDGSWTGNRGQYLIPMTALGGMALLAEGSTLREGKYRDNIRRAANWLMARQQANGLIGDPSNPALGGSYNYGHGYAMLFLSSLVGEEDTKERRRDLVRCLEKAAKFSFESQTSRGGWGYVSAKDGSDFDEGSVTITQVQGIRAARNAGIIVPGDLVKNAVKYLKESTGPDGDIQYSLVSRRKAISPALTAAAISCGFAAGEYDNPLVKQWFSYCVKVVPSGLEGGGFGGRRAGHDEYTNFYYAQAVYVLGEDRYGKMFPTVPDNQRVKWSKYRKMLFDELKNNMTREGPDKGYWGATNWTAQGIGPMYVTAVYLIVMQLDKAVLPIYQR